MLSAYNSVSVTQWGLKEYRFMFPFTGTSFPREDPLLHLAYTYSPAGCLHRGPFLNPSLDEVVLLCLRNALSQCTCNGLLFFICCL